MRESLFGISQTMTAVNEISPGVSCNAQRESGSLNTFSIESSSTVQKGLGFGMGSVAFNGMYCAALR